MSKLPRRVTGRITGVVQSLWHVLRVVLHEPETSVPLYREEIPEPEMRTSQMRWRHFLGNGKRSKVTRNAFLDRICRFISLIYHALDVF